MMPRPRQDATSGAAKARARAQAAMKAAKRARRPAKFGTQARYNPGVLPVGGQPPAEAAAEPSTPVSMLAGRQDAYLPRMMEPTPPPQKDAAPGAGSLTSKDSVENGGSYRDRGDRRRY